MPSDFTVLSSSDRRRKGADFDPQPAGLDPRQIEDVVEQLQQGAGRFAGRVDVVAHRGRKLFRQREVRHAQDRVHGRAQLVAHARQELALGHVGRLRLGGPLLQRLHQADALHGDRHLVGHGADQPQILFGERLPLHGTEGKGSDHAALVQQRTAGVGPDAELADQFRPRLDRGLDVLGRHARGIAGRAPAHFRAVFEPLDLAGGLGRDAFGRVQPQLVLLLVHAGS